MEAQRKRKVITQVECAHAAEPVSPSTRAASLSARSLGMSEHVRIVAVARASGAPQQFILAVGEVRRATPRFSGEGRGEQPHSGIELAHLRF